MPTFPEPNQNNLPTQNSTQQKPAFSLGKLLKYTWLIFAQIIVLILAGYGLKQWLQPKTPASAYQIPNTQTEPTQPKAAISTTPTSYREPAQKAMPSVVNIFTSKKISRNNQQFFDWFFNFANPQKRAPDNDKAKPYSLGSGVILRADGYIVTNNHVIEGADQIEVAMQNGQTLKAKVIGSDSDTDLALLKVDMQQLPAIEVVQTQAEVGDIVLAIGNPFGVGQTTTLGIVSALGRSELGLNTFENFIQTDAAINPGNSGGALVDIHGKLLGINTAIFSKSGGSQGIGFAIPAQTVQQVVNALIKDGSVSRGYLGVEPKDLSQEIIDALGLKTKQGVIIARVNPQTPAAIAGLQAGDIILKVEDKIIKNSGDLLNTIAQYRPEQTINCLIFRQQKTITLTIKLAKRPNFKTEAPNQAENQPPNFELFEPF